MKIKIKDIAITGENPRENFDVGKLRELGESINVQGLLQPIIVRRREKGYELVVGERRYRACQLIGIPEIEAEIKDIDDLTCTDLRLIENIHREDLIPTEKDKAYAGYLMFIARIRGYDLSDDKQYHQLIDEASRRTGIKKNDFGERLKTMGLSEILENAGIEVNRAVMWEISKRPSLGISKQVRMAKVAQEKDLKMHFVRECLKEILSNPSVDIEEVVRVLLERKEKEKEEALKRKMKLKKAGKPKKKSGRPRKEIKPNEVLKELTAEQQKEIERVGEEAKAKAIRQIKKGQRGLPPRKEVVFTKEDWNDLTGSIWKGYGWETLPYEHPAKFPLVLAGRVIKMFTSKGETVLDPMFGSGATLVAANVMGRKPTGIDLSKKYVDDLKKAYPELKEKVQVGDARRIPLKEKSVELVLFSPPYWDAEDYTISEKDKENDVGGHQPFEKYLEMMDEVMGEMHRVLKPGRRMVIVIGDSHRKNREYSTHSYLTYNAEKNGFVLNGTWIWEKFMSRPPKPFGSYLRPYKIYPNHYHEYILCFEREEDEEKAK